jgi:glc operon protein GlcG
MTKLGIIAGVLATVCLPAAAQTTSVMVLDQAGAQAVLQAATESAQQRNAPSAIAVVDPAGDLLAFQRMDGVRPASAELAIQKARTAARLQRPTAEIEDNIDEGRTAFVTAGIMALRGGMPVRVNGEVVGAVGIAGLSKEIDPEIARTAAAAFSPPAKTTHRRRPRCMIDSVDRFNRRRPEPTHFDQSNGEGPIKSFGLPPSLYEGVPP